MASSGALKFTMINRQHDGLPLAASMDPVQGVANPEKYKTLGKEIVKKIRASPSSPRLQTLTTSGFNFHVLTESGLVVLTCSESRAPAWVCFGYLEDLLREFMSLHESEIASTSRPFAFVKFDRVIQKTKRAFTGSDMPSRPDRDRDVVKADLDEFLGYVRQVPNSGLTNVRDRMYLMIAVIAMIVGAVILGFVFWMVL